MADRPERLYIMEMIDSLPLAREQRDLFRADLPQQPPHLAPHTSASSGPRMTGGPLRLT
jgi:hypothetical protein